MNALNWIIIIIIYAFRGEKKICLRKQIILLQLNLLFDFNFNIYV